MCMYALLPSLPSPLLNCGTLSVVSISHYSLPAHMANAYYSFTFSAACSHLFS